MVATTDPDDYYERDNIIARIMINRETELEWLTSHLSRAERQLLVVYGRRRVGKTTLVTSALNELEYTSVYRRSRPSVSGSDGNRRFP